MSRPPATRRWIFVVLFVVVLSGLAVLLEWSLRPAGEPQSADIPSEMNSRGNDVAAETAPVADPLPPQADLAPDGGLSTLRPDRDDDDATTAAAPRETGHPADPLLAGSRLVREQWSAADALGNRERTAIYQTDLFKYPMLRVVENWSGKTGGRVSRFVMVADHLLAGPRAGVDLAAMEEQVAERGFKVVEMVGDSAVLLSFSTSVDDPAELPRRIGALADLEQFIEFSEPDYLVWPCAEPNDPDFSQLWGLNNLGGVNGYTAGADIDATSAWGVRNDASSVAVAVTDTGIRYDHQDLAPNMWRNPAEIPGDGIDNDGNGLVDDVFGYDAYDNDGDPMDSQGHGTHCAGTIGARGNNGLGMTGVAWNVQLMAGRFLGPNGGTTSDGIKVIDYSRQAGAHIISASWGGGGYSHALRNAIAACANAGIPFVAAAGNSGTNNDSLPHYPSSFDLPNIVAVAATDANDRLTDFSCYGRNSVDIAAPGWQIWSTYIEDDSTSAYRYLHGTSMATPHVSGALALAKAHYPDASMEALIDGLRHTADKLPSLDGKVATGGRLNLHRLLTELEPMLPPSNDAFDTPLVLNGGYATWSGGNQLATREPDESSYSPAAGERTLWFAWQAPYDGFATVSASSLGAGQRLVVFKGETRASLHVVFDSGAESTATADTRVNFLAEGGMPYRIVTAGNSLPGELFTLTLEVVGGNDLLSAAFMLEGEEFEIMGSNRGATAQPFENSAPHAGVGAGQSVWYRWDAPMSGPFSLNTEGSETDTVVAVYTGDPLNPQDFITVGANDDVSATLRWSRVDFEAVQGTSYYIAVDTAMGGLPGGFVLRGTTPAAPVITSQPVARAIPLGGRTVFSVGAEGAPPLRYQWFRDDEALPGAWENTLIIDPVTDDALGVYHVVVGNSYGTTVSDDAQLTEKLVAPAIVWKSGDQSLVPGAAFNLRVEARGSEPLAYEWSLNGELLPGEESASLARSSVTAADAGTYVCRVSNAAGQVSASIRITRVASPFESWQWRLEEMPGPAIIEMKVIGSKVYAVAGDRILVSTDGLEWSTWRLPNGFEGVSLAKLGSTWLCTGMDASNNGRCAISTDGVNWVLHAPTGLPAVTPLQHLTRLEVFNGRFIGQRANRNSVFGDVYTSTNGIAWTAATLGGTTTAVTANGPFAVGSGMILTGRNDSTNPPRAFRSENGTDWTLVSLPVNETTSTGTRGAMRWDGKFVIFSSVTFNPHGWVSENGSDWTLHVGRSWPGGIDFNGNFVSLGGAQSDGLSVAWAADPWTATNVFIKPATGDIISAYCEFNGRVLYGTQRGFLGNLTEPTELQPFGGTVTVPGQVVFHDKRFFVLGNPNFNSVRNSTPRVSGDGTNWRKMRPWTWSNRFHAQPENEVSAYTLAGFGGGYFWGTHDGHFAEGPAKGLLPHVMPEAPLVNGLPKSVSSLEAAGNTLLAIANLKLHRSANGGDSWTEVAGAPVFMSTLIKPNPVVIRSGSRWLVTHGAPASFSDYGFVHYSDNDGVSWTKSASNCKAGFIVPFKGELYGLENQSSTPGNVRGWKSTNNGTTWSVVTFHTTNKLANMEVLQLGEFGGSLVALVRDSNNARTVWFSNDGISWFAANAPLGIQNFATGLGQFVAYTSTGAIVQAGSPPAGGSAPVVRAAYPVHQSSVVIGSWVDVIGEAFDPEGAPITLECHVDGQLIGTAGAGAFRFRFRAENPKGHIVILRATDASGLVGSDELRVVAVPPQTGNLLDLAEGTDYLPKVALVEFNGAYYAAGASGLLRSSDGMNWQPVLLPSLSTKLKGMAAGNGSLVVQTEWGVLYTTRDGVNWQQVGPAIFAGYWITQPVIFSGGRFLIIQQVAGQQTINYQTSVNGIDWTSASVFTTANQAMIGNNGVIVSIHQNAWSGDKAVWSADGGNNWTAIPGIERLSGQSLGFAMVHADGVFLIAATDGRVWRSPDGKAWSQSNLPAPPSPGVKVSHAGGRFFVGSNDQYLYSAATTLGSSWQALSPPVRSGSVIHALGRFIAQGANGMAWSQNGISWKDAQGGPVLAIGTRLASNGERILTIDENGAAWSSNNGVVWTQDFAGSGGLAGSPSQVGQQMAKLGTRILLAGTHGMLLSSTDDGATWSPSKADTQAVPNTWHFNRVRVSAGTALATATLGNTAEKVVLRSVNGVDWQSLAALATHRIVDVSTDGTGTWLAVGSNAAIFRSNDHGQNWQSIANPGIATARAVVWFNNQWLIFGAATSGAASRCWSSPDGMTWTDLGPNGLQSSGNDFFHVEGHGRLVVWNRTDKPVISNDGINWQAFNGYSTFNSNSLYWVVPTDSGFLLATPFISAQARAQMFAGTPDGQSWQLIPNLQNDTLWGAMHESRLFLFAPGRVVEWSERDLELELAPLPMATMGVGDEVQSPAALRNPGGVPFSGQVDVDGWLSADGFFGDGNDVYVGRIQLTVPLLQPGEEVMVNLRFKLPNKIKPGDARLVVVLDPDGKLLEKNRANNVSISSGPAVSVPQRKLEVLANGNGIVSADQNAEYYPHGARIALVATPGKGARFAGWGGAAVGSLSETLVVMNGDKSVEADFVSTAALTIFTRGGGRVEQSVDDGIYLAGSNAQLNAIPLPGWTFSGWSGSLGGNQTAQTLLMDSNKGVTARFSLGLEAWREREFSAAELSDPSISDPSADADGDGLENWREWLRGSDPKNRASRGQGLMRREGNWLVLTYTRLENMPLGHAVRASASSDLSDWSVPLDERVVGSSNGVETVEARIDVSGRPGMFFRIGDTRPEP
jgi:subtilisin family serine protease